ncbi:MAG: glycosyltransferase [Methanobacteriaceae archaeon]|nr:glycosyltransferase [Methanobacteriaceae archaeon]
MKILHVPHFFVPCLSAGGVVNAAYQIAKKQVDEGHDVHVYTCDGCKERLKFDNRYDVDVDGITVDYFKNISNKFKLATMLDTPLSAPLKIKKGISSFDVIHIHEHRQTLAIISAYYARKHDIPYVVQAHGSVLPFFQKEGLKNIFDKTFGFDILHNASKVFALTEVEKEQYLKMGVKEENIEIVPLGINIEEYSDLPKRGLFREKFNISESDKLILFVGRIHKIKGLDLLVNAFKELCDDLNNLNDLDLNNLSDSDLIKSNNSVKLAIVGPDDGFLDELESLILKLGLKDNVIITGPLYKEEKQEALVDCDLFVMPSQYESFTTSGLEAMACSKPLVLTKNNHIQDWVNGNVGISCDYDSNSLKSAMYEVLSNEELASKFSKEGLRLVYEKYNWDVINNQIIDIYESISKN